MFSRAQRVRQDEERKTENWTDDNFSSHEYYGGCTGMSHTGTIMTRTIESFVRHGTSVTYYIGFQNGVSTIDAQCDDECTRPNVHSN
jgi:hypothetical protein